MQRSATRFHRDPASSRVVWFEQFLHNVPHHHFRPMSHSVRHMIAARPDPHRFETPVPPALRPSTPRSGAPRRRFYDLAPYPGGSPTCLATGSPSGVIRRLSLRFVCTTRVRRQRLQHRPHLAVASRDVGRYLNPTCSAATGPGPGRQDHPPGRPSTTCSTPHLRGLQRRPPCQLRLYHLQLRRAHGYLRLSRLSIPRSRSLELL